MILVNVGFNPFTAKFSPEKTQFLIVKPVFGCHGAKWTLVLLRKLFLPRREISPRFGTKIWHMSMLRGFFAIAFSNCFFLFFASSLSFFRPLSSRYLFGCHKNVCCPQMEPCSIISIMGHLTTIFASKLRSISKTGCCADTVDLS